MFVAWVVFPFLLCALALGCGLVLERIAGTHVPGALLLPLGTSVIVVVAQAAVLFDATAELAVPAVIALSVLGFALTERRRRSRPDVWALAAAVMVFLLFGAPVILSGTDTWAGYLRLDDNAVWFAFVDRLMDHGRSLDGLMPSAYRDILDTYFGSGYPVGAFLPLGVGRELVGEDVAWLFQPYVAFLAGMLALSLYGIAGRLTDVRWQRALGAVIAAQAAMLFGYALVGGVKEVASAGLLALAVALLPTALDGRGRLAVLPLAVTTGAAVSVMSYGGLVWLLPVLVAGVVILVLRQDEEDPVRRVASFAGLAFVCCLPAVPAMLTFLKDSTDVLTTQGDLGGAGVNLLKPINPLQALGIWPVGDFRATPGNEAATYFLIAVLILAALGGIAWAYVRGAIDLLVYVGAAAIGLIVITIPGSPWVDSKAFAIASPAAVFAATVGALALFRTGRRFEAALLAVALAGGVLWSNVLAYNEVYLAPRDRMGQLEGIGKRIAGQGPTLMVDAELLGAQHFLRDAAPRRPLDLPALFRPDRVSRSRTGDGVQVSVDPKFVADPDSYALPQLLRFRTLLLPRSPMASRPPSVYKLIDKTSRYEVWQRPSTRQPEILEHLSLPTDVTKAGATEGPAGRARCSDIRRIARRAGPSGVVAAVPRSPVAGIPLSQGDYPAAWGHNTLGVFPTGSGTVAEEFQVEEPGAFDLWLNGAFRQPVKFSVDGRKVSRVDRELMLTGEYAPLGRVRLSRGTHKLELHYGGSTLYPGAGGAALPFGPILISDGTADRPVQYLAPADAKRLCGQSLDWVEALSSRPSK